MMTKSKIAAVVSHFELFDESSKTLEAIRAQVDFVIEVNKKSTHHAAELNKAIEKARSMACDYVLLCNDSAIAAPDLVARLLAAEKKLRKTNQKQPAVIAANIYSHSKQSLPYITSKPQSANYQRVGFNANTSILQNLTHVDRLGCLIPMEMFDHIGLFKKDFKNLFYEVDFCLRARKSGFDVVAVRDAILNPSKTEIIRTLFGITFVLSQDSPAMRKESFRNRKQIWKKYYREDAGFVWFDILRAQREVLCILIFEKQKISKIQAILQGFMSNN